MTERTKFIELAVSALDQKKGFDICVLNVKGLTTLTDNFIFASCNSKIQAQALADHLEETLKKEGFSPIHKEGYNTAEWILLGYEDTVIHIFIKEARDFYGLEHIWSDGESIDISDIISED